MTTLAEFSLKKNGKSKHRLGYHHTPEYGRVYIGYFPLISSEHFEFAFKIHSVENVLVGLGFGDEEEGGYPGQKGWGWQDFGWTYCNNSSESGSPKYTEGDVVGFEVNKRLNKIFLIKNGVNLGEDKYFVKINQKFPEKLQIAGCCHYKLDHFELVHFVDYCYNKNVEEDLNERTEFILNEIDTYIFKEEDKKKIITNVKIGNADFGSVCKVLLLK